MVVSSAKFTILISWSPLCITLIILSVLMKLESTSIAIMYNSMNSRHPWETRINVKGSNRRTFILKFFESTLMMWMNLSLYPNLCKTEKVKSTLRILQKDIYWVYLAYQLSHNEWKECKIIPFLKASYWCSPIIVSNVSCIWFFRISSINLIV